MSTCGRSRVEHSPPSDKLYANPLLGAADHRRLDARYAASTSRCARPVPRPRACWSQAAAARLGVDAAELTTRDGEVIHTASGQKHRLRRAGRRRGQAAGADDARAQGPKRVPHHRHAGQAPRRAGEGQRHGQVRHRRARSGHEGRGHRASRRCSAARLPRSTRRRRWPCRGCVRWPSSTTPWR